LAQGGFFALPFLELLTADQKFGHPPLIKYWMMTYLVARKALRLSPGSSIAVASVGENVTCAPGHRQPSPLLTSF